MLIIFKIYFSVLLCTLLFGFHCDEDWAFSQVLATLQTGPPRTERTLMKQCWSCVLLAGCLILKLLKCSLCCHLSLKVTRKYAPLEALQGLL